MERWAVGRQVLLRYLRTGEIRGVRPCTVVADEPTYTLLWLTEGTTVRFPRTSDGRPIRELPLGRRYGRPWYTGDGSWADSDALILSRPGRWHSVYFFFEPGGGFRNWYVNTELPFRRWDDGEVAGLDTDDLELDVVIGPDLVGQIKDEDELAAAYDAGEIPIERVQRVRREAADAIEDAKAGRWPYDGTWTDFRADPAWPTPTLPTGWDRPTAND